MEDPGKYESDAETAGSNESGTNAFVRYPYDKKARLGRKELAKVGRAVAAPADGKMRR